MNIESAQEFANKMRALLRRIDTFGYDRQEIIMTILQIAENYEEIADGLEMKKIVQMQRDWVEAN